MLPHISRVTISNEHQIFKDRDYEIESDNESKRSYSLTKNPSKEFLQTKILSTKIQSFIELLLERK